MKKIFLGLVVVFSLIITCHLVFVSSVLAAGEFSSSYKVTYDVNTLGETEVTEEVNLKNLTDRYYASSFTLTIGATQISDVSAFDSSGAMNVEVSKNNTKTNITVKFASQIVGKDKEYPWTLKFKSKDFAQAQGKTWQVSIPKISSLENLDQYNVTLSTPVTFGDPTSITPEPKKQMESGGKLNFFFDKNQLTDSGVLANFGTEQLFSFKMSYKVSNKAIVPTLAKLPLPQDTQYQQIIIDNVNPKPDNVTIDNDGNYIGWFSLGSKKEMTVEISGLAKLSFASNKKVTLSKSEEHILTSSQKYWEKDSPQIKSKLSEIFKDNTPSTNSEKARLIYKFVTNFLQYDEERLKKENFERFGALTTLANPDKSLCLEFSDLFITLARAAGVPAREIIGFAYTANNDLRPLSLGGTILHAWSEYYDPSLGWLMVDPTWENTTGGVDYFSRLDLNHFGLLTRGFSSVEPNPPGDVSVKFSDVEFKPVSKITVTVDSPSEIYAAFPSALKVRVQNLGNAISTADQLNLSSANLKIVGRNPAFIPVMPPFGSYEYRYDLRSDKLWQSYVDILQVTTEDQKIEKRITVKPFFAYKYFSLGVIGLIGIMVTIYGLILFLRLKNRNLKT